MENLNTKVLFSKDQLQARIEELGKQISQDYGNEPIVVIGVLKGSFIFMADLIRSINSPLEIDFIGVSSYEGTSSTGHVRITNDLKMDIAGRNILLVEDIIDTGLTIDYLINLFKVSNPKSLKVCSLLSKPEAHQMTHTIDYVGFEISREFVIGYGLDLDERYREIPEILQVIE
ncbi:hypoxanthine phosphoribosyltransferase [Pseudobacteriovorax antillogorgiicola]|uniref:Hypoxanthine phosphoribosyltransferase n=1 Tax=Pseudobacteriovorax antillogorgiicola TaxID=1513793 RepID=A0A1Y6BZM7_9BACT|nr:hypoxanthine phosphoribosyltransferase [Pseudobacteriovorax antillogorgiicola]TCS51169.1 hypoxanthine phosphoribosyltransferase [Pseudobacteriovorax antillogorgiicola]SMF38057.1 hypoxanthine phosphoribosyltransferase [Pseudobacteriovorax antillogorgiicola]